MSYSSRRESFATVLGGASFLACFGIVGWQIFHYLKDGDWQPLSVITAMGWAGLEWAFSPTSWLGLYKVLDWMPLSIAALALTLLASIILSADS